jgi:hypothetical protein
LVSTDPAASSTARDTMFSEAINSICSRWRCSSPFSTASIAGSASARLLVNMGSGASLILAAA